MSKQLLATVLASALAAAFLAAPASAAATSPRKTLAAFASEQELQDLFTGWAEDYRRRREAERSARRDQAQSPQMAAPLTAAKSAAGALASSSDAESITNVQHAGVDEGGIVKVHGDHLVILRRGRVFALMGYEIVEGRLAADRISEMRRVNLAPRAAVEIAP
jgi:uncharacterized secreted protein with C-terminal beta-propeller domain